MFGVDHIFVYLAESHLQFHFETCHLIPTHIVRESVVRMTCDVQVEQKCNTVWNQDDTLSKFWDVDICFTRINRSSWISVWI